MSTILRRFSMSQFDPSSIILEGITGSTAYGLATPDSDVDKHGVYQAQTREVLGLFPPKETVVTNDPDITYHEVAKFIRLAAKANPTVLEILYLDDYTVVTPVGQLLIDHRLAFLSKTIYHSYGGYAIAQARRLNYRGDSFSSDTKKRYAKHSRHCFRLLQQGRQLLKTGTLDVKVKNRDELFAIGELPVSDLVDRFEAEFKEFDKIKTALPDKPDYDTLNALLIKIREDYAR
jgi:predicted nucleotidyltransferase